MERTAVVGVLRSLRENPEDFDLSSLSSSLLQLASSSASERKMLVKTTSGGVGVITRTLQIADDLEVVHNLIATLDCLAKHRYTEKLIKRGVLPAVLSSMVWSSRREWCNDSLLHLYHSLLLRLASKDKNFPIKARLSGAVPVTVGLLKRSLSDPSSLHTLLILLKILATNSANAVFIGRHGCLSLLSKLLDGLCRKNYIILKLCADALAPLLKQKSLCSKSSGQSCVGHLLSLHHHCHLTDRQGRHLPLRKSLLLSLKAATSSGCDAVSKNDGLEILYSTASYLHSKTTKGTKSLATLNCSVLKSVILKLPLPISSTYNPYHFSLPRPPNITNETSDDVGDKETIFLPHDLPAPAIMSSLNVSSSTVKELTESDIPGVHQHLLTGPDTVIRNSILPPSEQLTNIPKIMQEEDEEKQKWGAEEHEQEMEGRDEEDRKEEEEEEVEIEEEEEEEEEGLVVESQLTTESIDDKMSNQKLSESDSPSSTTDHKDPSMSPDEMVLYDKFFPELVTQILRKTETQTSSSSVQSSSAQQLEQRVELVCSEEQEDEGDDEGRLQGYPSCSSMGDSKNPHTECGVSLITGLIGEASHKEEEKLEEEEEEEEEEEGVKSVPVFVELPTPQVLGHISRPDPEPLYKRPPSVVRSVILEDAARYISSGVIQRTVYDLDSLVPHTTNSTENVMELRSGCGQEEIRSRCGQEELRSRCSQEEVGSRCGQEEVGGGCGQEGLGTGCGLQNDDTNGYSSLMFESRFECGNLRKAIQVRENEYDLILNSDITAGRHHQWFFFKVWNMTEGQEYRFNIINFEKSNSQFNYGMQPLLYSEREAREGRPHWSRIGSSITYYKNNFFTECSGNRRIERGRRGERRTRGRKGKMSGEKKWYHTLAFRLAFPHDDDHCYLAYHFPYSYSMLLCDMKEIERMVDTSTTFYRHQTLCSSLGGNPCPLLTITSNSSPPDSSPPTEEEKMVRGVDERDYVVLSARVHPGESNSSWVMRGVLQYLVSPEAESLREQFVFKIIPMLNPDGVINGSHRCSLSGVDLNRQWIDPCSTLHPTIYHSKNLLRWLVAHQKPPLVYCDFHGHSQRKNIFMYGCKSGTKLEQILPDILDTIAPSFSRKSCSYTVEKSKEATARVVVWRRLRIPLSYTMESTYCATDQGPYKDRQITTGDLEEMGRCFCHALALLKKTLLASREEDREDAREGDRVQIQETEEAGGERNSQSSSMDSSTGSEDLAETDDDFSS